MVKRNALRDPAIDPEQPFTPTEPTTEFTLSHNFGYPPVVIILDDDGCECWAEIEHDAGYQTVTLRFGHPEQPNVWLR